LGINRLGKPKEAIVTRRNRETRDFPGNPEKVASFMARAVMMAGGGMSVALL
jgi:hypothetical protein